MRHIYFAWYKFKGTKRKGTIKLTSLDVTIPGSIFYK